MTQPIRSFDMFISYSCVIEQTVGVGALVNPFMLRASENEIKIILKDRKSLLLIQLKLTELLDGIQNYQCRS